MSILGFRRSLGLSRLEGLVWVAAIAVVWVAFGTAGTVYDVGRTGHGLMFFVGLIVGLPLVLALNRPLTGLLVSLGSAVLLAVLVPRLDNHFPWSWLVVHGLVIFVLLFVTCIREPPDRALGGSVLTACLFYWGVPRDLRGGWLAGVIIIAVIGLLIGRLVSTRRALAVQAEVSLAEKARRVVLEERASIARDLHDIVAHHMSLVVVQAETAGYRVPDLSDSARAELLSIGETARSALSETRALLTVLRQEHEPSPDAPQPGLHQIPELVDAARRAGALIEAKIAGDLGVLGAGSSLAVYRIAQEALANATRHAPGSVVRLEVDASAGQVRLLVVNRVVSAASEAGVGHGITGMRERAAAIGARLWIGPSDPAQMAETAGEFVVELALTTNRDEQPPETIYRTPSDAVDSSDRSESAGGTVIR